MITEQLYYVGLKALITNADGSLLLLQSQRPDGSSYWDLPGGRINKGEDATQAFRREIIEETGLTEVSIGKQIAMEITPVQIPISENETGGLVLAVFACTARIDKDIVTEEGVAFEWCPVPEALARLSKFSEECRGKIKAALEQ